MEEQPKLYILSGCNGAGKTTAAYTLLPEVLACREFVNADEIAADLCAPDPASVALKAGRIMLGRINNLLSSGRTFAIETTLATRSYAHLVKKAQNLGYIVELLFVWLENVDMARMRVARRVAEGGHDIPDHVIKRRYFSGLKNFFDVFSGIVDFWTIADNSLGRYEIVASSCRIENAETYKRIEDLYDRNRKGESLGSATPGLCTDC